MSLIAIAVVAIMTVATFFYAMFIVRIGFGTTTIITMIIFGIVLFVVLRYMLSVDEMNTGIWFIIIASVLGTNWDKIRALLPKG